MVLSPGSAARRGFNVRRVLAPFRKDLLKYLAGTVVRQALVVLGGYSMVWAIRIATGHQRPPLWWLAAGLIAFDAIYITLDTALSAMFARRLSLPLFASLRSAALSKVFAMPLEWHQNETSGALVAKVNNGVGRVVQSGEALSRELCPSLIRTAFS